MQGAGFRVQGSGFRVQGVGCRVQGPGFRVLKIWALNCRVRPESHDSWHMSGFSGAMIPRFNYLPVETLNGPANRRRIFHFSSFTSALGGV